MLAISDETALNEEAWAALESRAALPCSWEEFVAEAGLVKHRADSRRKFVRVGLRQIAIFWHEGQAYAGYTKNVSRISLAFYSPINLLPLSEIRLWIPGHPVFNLATRRCRRLKESCFECGAIFKQPAK
jgi:hypothetical protein